VHRPVLVEEVLDGLRIRPDGIYVDCTAGAGGHASRIAERLTTGRLIALDRDPDAVARARERLAPYGQATVVHANFGDVGAVCAAMALPNLDGALIDAGVSSMQIDAPERGFSFQQTGPLDMRMDPTHEPDAAAFLAALPEAELAALLTRYGDVRPARRIAAAIKQRARDQRLQTTTDLRDAVVDALPFVHGEPAEVRTVFQAVRIAVNREFEALEQALDALLSLAAPGGRIAVIAFHSGEARIVKNLFREAARTQRELALDGRVLRTHPPRIRVLTRTPILPTAAECAANPRAHSARLRVVERLEDSA